MNAIAAAARYGMALDGATAYVTHQPCFTCAKELVQAGIAGVYYAIALPIHDDDVAKDLYLKQTEARLLGQLRAVHVREYENALDALRLAATKFDAEREAATKRATQAAGQLERGIARDGNGQAVEA
jgi:tRNA(Arg) A34 adenosine deaminase TadA